jgi:hypothetical protein
MKTNNLDKKQKKKSKKKISSSFRAFEEPNAIHDNQISTNTEFGSSFISFVDKTSSGSNTETSVNLTGSMSKSSRLNKISDGVFCFCFFL